jgi:hypothetical protein
VFSEREEEEQEEGPARDVRMFERFEDNIGLHPRTVEHRVRIGVSSGLKIAVTNVFSYRAASPRALNSMKWSVFERRRDQAGGW